MAVKNSIQQQKLRIFAAKCFHTSPKNLYDEWKLLLLGYLGSYPISKIFKNNNHWFSVGEMQTPHPQSLDNFFIGLIYSPWFKTHSKLFSASKLDFQAFPIQRLRTWNFQLPALDHYFSPKWACTCTKLTAKRRWLRITKYA